MTDQNFNDESRDFNREKAFEQDPDPIAPRAAETGFMEETAAEVAPRLGTFDGGSTTTDERPRAFVRPEGEQEEGTAGKGLGGLALILSVLSLFFLPVLLGAAGIIVGFIARRRGAQGLGNWAIGIGAVSMIIALFITPFFY
ncbi:DUF4190 domain-containing protein [Bacillus sp. Marseille-P3661]|uniref:DUF4190 domain-containing protein n=1 Tax=Bacillus sp. Marseille-P3661 TaxID=1936234 RepID=UPI000C815528|nr:DUF4190 domain-containing protein [Bacillus sp. Marseille-P3661]